MIILLLAWLTSVVAEPSIRVTSPTKNTEFRSGFRETITWESSELPADAPLGIKIVDAAGFSLFSFKVWDRSKVVASFETTNTGSFEVTAPLLNKDDDSFVVVVYYRLDDEVVASSEEFSVKVLPTQITLSAPTSAVVLRTGEPVTISWTSSGLPEDATLVVSLRQMHDGLTWLGDSMKTVQEIARDVPNSAGQYVWHVPLSTPIGADYVIELAWRDSGYAAHSERLLVNAGDKSLTFVAPRDNTVWALIGTPKTVEWRAEGFAADVRFNVELYQVLRGNKLSVAQLAQSTSDARIYAQLPREGIEPGLHFVRVSVSGVPTVFADSERFYVEQGDESGIYSGRDRNLVSKDMIYAASSTLQVTLFSIAAGALASM